MTKCMRTPAKADYLPRRNGRPARLGSRNQSEPPNEVSRQAFDSAAGAPCFECLLRLAVRARPERPSGSEFVRSDLAVYSNWCSDLACSHDRAVDLDAASRGRPARPA